MIELIFDGKGVFSRDPESVEKLEKNYFGRSRKGMIFLELEDDLKVQVIDIIAHDASTQFNLTDI